jgi:hypothetical protein
MKTSYKDSLVYLEQQYNNAQANHDDSSTSLLRTQYQSVLKKAIPGYDANDTNFHISPVCHRPFASRAWSGC